jgi:hypothetical protein
MCSSERKDLWFSCLWMGFDVSSFMQGKKSSVAVVIFCAQKSLVAVVIFCAQIHVLCYFFPVYICCMYDCCTQAMFTVLRVVTACTDNLLVSGQWNLQAESSEWVIRVVIMISDCSCNNKWLSLPLHIQSGLIHDLCWVLLQPKTNKWLVVWYLYWCFGRTCCLCQSWIRYLCLECAPGYKSALYVRHPLFRILSFQEGTEHV